MLFCLNLPLELQYLPENTFFAGITPGPREPTVTTINFLSDPIVDALESMWHGKSIKTYLQPDGIMIRVGVLPAIGDLLPSAKLLDLQE
jgi:hypothetical protein